MPPKTFRIVTRGTDGSLRIKDYPSQDSLLEMHTQIGVDDCSTNLSLRGLPIFRGLVLRRPVFRRFTYAALDSDTGQLLERFDREGLSQPLSPEAVGIMHHLLVALA